MRKFTILILLILGTQIVYGQNQKKPKKIKFKDTFHHKISNTIFTKELAKEYFIKDAFSFDKKKSSIGVNYEKKISPKGLASVYIYPAGDGHETRLQEEYLKAIHSIADLTDKGLALTQFPVKYKGQKFDCNGFKATFKSPQNEYSNLSVYECGTWFLKLRLTTEETDSLKIDSIEQAILKEIDPSKLIEQKQLNSKANIYFAKAAFQDSTLLGSIMGSAYKKVQWIIENVSSRERASGFSGHYLQLQIEGFKEILEFDREHKMSRSEFTENYLKEVRLIIESDYVDEFIMEEYSMVMIVPEKHEFDFKGYELWKQNNEISLDLSKHFYIISFAQE